jgi:hypothetical protein
MSQLLGLSKMKNNTQWVPLALLGYRLQQRDFFAPLSQHLELTSNNSAKSKYTLFGLRVSEM